jgi:uncharacterized protein
MDVEVEDNSAEHRYEVRVEGEIAGFTAYRELPGRRSFTHTEIAERFEGQGLGSKLISAALDDARAHGLEVLPFCPFVKAFIERHREYADLVPEAERQNFGLGS